ncbi:MAG: hypothetical protein K5769_10595 [Pseudobutyrivibrio sp.]|nr:hypothetical protein [Pseudobutyrivibrio sp.]
MEKFSKITNESLNLKVEAQSCKNDCTETVWAGRTAAEGWKAGCWYKTAQTPRTATWL